MLFSVENIQWSRQKPVPSLEPSSNEITDASLSTVVRSEGTFALSARLI